MKLTFLFSSMYIDEDGDVAHEFYEEVKIGSSQTTTMKKKITNLRPQVCENFKKKKWYLQTLC